MLAVIACLCVLATSLLAWSRYASSRPADGQPGAASQDQVRRIADWARAVRAAAPPQRASAVAERFDASVPEDRRTPWAESIAAALGRADRDAPLSVNLFRGGSVKAVWTCGAPPAGRRAEAAATAGPAHLALLFRRGDDGRLWLLGPMP